MRNSFIAMVAATISCFATAASAEVLITLDSGSEVRAVRAWREGDVVRVAFRSGIASFPAATVVSIEETSADRDPRPRPLTETHETRAPGSHAAGAPSSRVAAASSPAAAPAPGAAVAVDEHVPDFAGEDTQTKLEHLDALALQTHRELSIARTQGQPQETLDALQRKIDDINAKRDAAMKRLGR